MHDSRQNPARGCVFTDFSKSLLEKLRSLDSSDLNLNKVTFLLVFKELAEQAHSVVQLAHLLHELIGPSLDVKLNNVEVACVLPQSEIQLLWHIRSVASDALGHVQRNHNRIQTIVIVYKEFLCDRQLRLAQLVLNFLP